MHTFDVSLPYNSRTFLRNLPVPRLCISGKSFMTAIFRMRKTWNHTHTAYFYRFLKLHEYQARGKHIFGTYFTILYFFMFELDESMISLNNSFKLSNLRTYLISTKHHIPNYSHIIFLHDLLQSMFVGQIVTMSIFSQIFQFSKSHRTASSSTRNAFSL